MWPCKGSLSSLHSSLSTLLPFLIQVLFGGRLLTGLDRLTPILRSSQLTPTQSGSTPKRYMIPALTSLLDDKYILQKKASFRLSSKGKELVESGQQLKKTKKRKAQVSA